jgi:uncharacterized lipoprotein YajG
MQVIIEHYISRSMKMKKITLFAVIAMAAAALGCSKDNEVKAFIAEFDAATEEMVAKIDANPSSEGIEAAQRAFDARKPELKAKWDSIKDAVGIQVSKETKAKLEESLQKNMKALTEVSMRNMVKMAADREASLKYRRLMEDYSKTFSVTG